MSVKIPDVPALGGSSVLSQVYVNQFGAWQPGQPYPKGMLSFLYHVISTKEINDRFRNGEPVMADVFALPVNPDQMAVTEAGNAGAPTTQLITAIVNCISNLPPSTVQALVEELSRPNAYATAW